MCPLCGEKTWVQASRSVEAGRGTYRRRICKTCGHKFNTIERESKESFTDWGKKEK